MKVRYIGPHAAVEVVLPSGAYSEPVKQGEVFDTTDEHAEALLEQTTNWEPVKAPEKKKGGDS